MILRLWKCCILTWHVLGVPAFYLLSCCLRPLRKHRTAELPQVYGVVRIQVPGYLLGWPLRQAGSFVIVGRRPGWGRSRGGGSSVLQLPAGPPLELSLGSGRQLVPLLASFGLCNFTLPTNLPCRAVIPKPCLGKRSLAKPPTSSLVPIQRPCDSNRAGNTSTSHRNQQPWQITTSLSCSSASSLVPVPTGSVLNICLLMWRHAWRLTLFLSTGCPIPRGQQLEHLRCSWFLFRR